MKVKYLFCAFIIFGWISGTSQVKPNVQITQAYFSDDTLKVLFKNNGNKTITVPNLSYRIGSSNNTMYKKFYRYSGDSVYISLKEKIDKNLYTANPPLDHLVTESRLFYIDEKLSPKRQFWTFVKLNKIGSPKVLVLEYENQIWICPIKN